MQRVIPAIASGASWEIQILPSLDSLGYVYEIVKDKNQTNIGLPNELEEIV